MHQSLLTIEEAAERLRVPVSTLRYWRLHGLGPKSARWGRRVYYLAEGPDGIDAYIDAQFAGDDKAHAAS